MLQFPEVRTRWRRHRLLHEDPADQEEDHQDPRPQELPSSATKELDKSTKYDATLVIVVVLSYS